MTNAVRENDKLLFRAVFLFDPKTPHRRLMKKFNLSKKLLALVLTLAALFTVLCGCSGDALEGKATVVLHGDTDVVYELDLKECGFKEKDNVYVALKWLYDNKEMPFSANTTFNDKGFDAFINSVGDLNPAYNTTQYIAFFHNVESQKDTYGYVDNVTYNNTTLYYSAVGVGGLELTDGLIIYFTILSY